MIPLSYLLTAAREVKKKNCLLRFFDNLYLVFDFAII